MDILQSSIALKYPLYACDFDPQDPDRLIVGGGGGASRTGVGNCITLLSAATPSDPELHATAEIELSKDEDNVTSLVAGPPLGKTTKTTTLVYAGVNASPADQKLGKNEHFRVLAADGSPQMAERARTSLFEHRDPADLDLDTYQRLLRLSPPFVDDAGRTRPQLGACATGLAKHPQLVVFDVAPSASASASASTSVLPRVRRRLHLTREANDLDLIQTADDRYQVAFCSNHELHLLDISTADDADNEERSPRLTYTIPLDVASGATARPTFRAIRYLTPRFVLAALNLPKRTGVVLMGLRLADGPHDADADADGSKKTRIAVNARLPRAIAQATSLAVRDLAPPAAPGSPPQHDTQFAIAVAGAPDNALSLYTLELQTAPGGVELLTKLHPFAALPRVHELQITDIALSVPTDTKTDTETPYLRLASVSVQNTAVVHHIPLRRLPGTTTTTTAQRPRLVVALRSRAPSSARSLVAFITVVMVLIALVAQGLLEVLALTQPRVGARDVVPASWLVPLPPRLGGPPIADVPTVDVPVDVAALFQGNLEGAAPPDIPPVLFLRGDDVDHTAPAVVAAAALHDPDVHGPAAPWDALPPQQQAAWRQRLADDGHWGADMGEAVFKGVLFSELAGVIGAAVH